jgi:hypothetical protein
VQKNRKIKKRTTERAGMKNSKKQQDTERNQDRNNTTFNN